MQPSCRAQAIFQETSGREYAVTIGIPGLALYLAFLRGCTRLVPGSFLSWMLRAVFIAYLAQGIFIHDTIQTWPLVWCLAGIAIVVGRRRNRDTRTCAAA